ncbi:SDR family NAD(P)-dependent oxidoreductase [Marinobacter sp. LV10MA510-1]|uniref:SDR family NAD(P)-dependent oxidoreductase n=1 Tax=Marinobacter sp. LV10MA510-1 TaxID=1415567 RepID=UPI000BF7C0D9|nr:SDR family NAD(P)-dependent oxidoreductase [Marinobacter sp. LV10MA510-1]PFG11731.1 3-oxoacyl-[acyl-carrier protein] reductase [Marinobacter sp. LV10MA510-1]
MDTVMVTGGTRGLGLAISKRLVDSGYRVVIVGRNKTDACDEWLDSNSLASFEPYDFNDTTGVHQFCQSVSRNYGRLYGLVNNAAQGVDGVLATMHETDIARSLRVNVEAPMLLTKYLLRPMLINQRGRVINVSSIIAATGYKGLSVYGATKAALEGFTRSLSREVGKAGITVNCVAPGYMATDMTLGMDEEKLRSIRRRSPMGALVGVEDVANMVNYLLSDEARMITGTVMTVDAGSSA